jgi:hypothetical protein
VVECRGCVVKCGGLCGQVQGFVCSIIYTLQITLARLFYFTIDSLISSCCLNIESSNRGMCSSANWSAGSDLDTYLGLCLHEWNRQCMVQTEDTGHVTLNHSDTY